MKTKWQPRWMYYASICNACISAKTWSSALMKAHLWSTNDGNTSWTINGRQGHCQDIKPASGKIAKCFYSYSFYSCKKFIPWQLSSGSRYCSTHNTNVQHLLVSSTFSVVKINGATHFPMYLGTHEYETKSTGSKQCFLFFTTTITSYGGLDSVVLHSLPQIT